MGGCLRQKDDEGNYRPLRFMSRGFDRYEKAQENRERELRAGWFCMLKCHSMLDHRVFTWFCDHSNARWAMPAKMEHQRIARLALWLSQYYYTLQHIAGEHILLKIVDAVSRLPIPTSVEDQEIFSPSFETTEVQSILTASITPDIIQCPRHFDISTSTHAQLHRTGVDIVPSAPLLSFHFTARWALDKMPTIAFHMLPPPASSPTSTYSPMLTGMEGYASFPTPTGAICIEPVSLCARWSNLMLHSKTLSTRVRAMRHLACITNRSHCFEQLCWRGRWRCRTSLCYTQPWILPSTHS